jgi:hypothetical protein
MSDIYAQNIQRILDAMKQQDDHIGLLWNAIDERNEEVRRLIHSISRQASSELQGMNVECVAEALYMAADKALKRIRRRPEWRVEFHSEFGLALNTVANKLFRIGKEGLSSKDLIQRVEQRAKELREKAARELDDLRQKILTTKQELERLSMQKAILEPTALPTSDYPPIPPPVIQVPEECCESVPEVYGVYFAWASGRVAYVGQSTNIRKRCSIRTHGSLRDGDWLSWHEVKQDRRTLNFTEAYYIGLAQPPRNFGGGRTQAMI